MTAGNHKAFVRFKNSQGEWGKTNSIDFNIIEDTVSVYGEGFDAIFPEISFQPSTFLDTMIEIGTDIIITAGISDNISIDNAHLFYRQGGIAVWDSVAMEILGDIYLAKIPAEDVTERGIEYYLEASDSVNITVIPEESPIIPAYIRITIPNLPSIQTEENDYCMFSLPADLFLDNAADLLGKELGNYNTEVYRLFRWENGSYIELSENPDFVFTPGRAYWLITSNAEIINFDSSKSVRSDESFNMTLYAGWNQVGSPFYFPVAWADIIKENPGVIQGEKAWEYSAKGWTEATVMEPFKGYLIQTLSSGNTLKIPPREFSESADNILAKHEIQDGEWCARLLLESGDFHDRDNYLGWFHDAENEWDVRDYSTPLPMSDQFVTLDFNNTNWMDKPGLYSGDFKKFNSLGQFWDIKLQSRNTENTVDLKIEQLGELPPGFVMYLIDPLNNKVLEYSEDFSFHIDGHTNMEKQFRFIVGTEEYFNENNLGARLLPESYILSQNFPNPFNNRTTIEFALPEEARVSIIIYNSMGQQIISPINSVEMMQGYHQFTWNGENGFGERVATGIYFYQLTSEKFSMIRKMLLLK